MAAISKRCIACKKPLRRKYYFCCASCKNNYRMDECSQVSTKRFDLLEKSPHGTWKCLVCIKAKRSSTSTPMKASATWMCLDFIKRKLFATSSDTKAKYKSKCRP